eukprot:gene22469-30726_t
MANFKANIKISAKQCIVEFCENCNSSNTIIRTAFEGINDHIEGITNRLLRGTQAELSSYINENFKIPLGLKLHLTKFLTNNFFHASSTAVSTSTRHFVYNANLSTKEAILVKVLEEWKMGKLLPENYYTYLHNLVVKGALSTEAAQKLIYFSLQRASWEINRVDRITEISPSPKRGSNTQRISCISSAFELEDVQSLCLKGHSLTINRRNGAFSQIDLNGPTLKEAKCFHTEKYRRYPTKSGLVWWEFRRGIENMNICHTVVQLEGATKEAPYSTTQPSTRVEPKLMLTIGDSIECSDGVLEIDEVIAVDDWSPPIQLLQGRAPSKGSSIMYNIAILIDGRLTSTTKAQHLQECDGVSEIGDEEELLNASNGSGNDENSGQNKTCGFVEACRKYFFLYASYHRGVVHVCKCVELNQYLISDQIPSNVLCAGSELAVVSGTNGLLGILPLDTTIPSIIGTNSDRLQHGEHEDIKEYISLTKDSIAEDSTESTTPMNQSGHRNSTAITLTSFSSNSSILVTGDSDGLLCWWRVGGRDERYRVNLISSYGTINSERLHSLQISANGFLTAVGLSNSLILLRQKEVILEEESGGSSPICSVVPVPAYLDFIENVKPRYKVSFEKDAINIWRICKHNSHYNRSHQSTSRTLNSSSSSVVENSVVDDEANNLRASKEGILSSRHQSTTQQVEISYWYHRNIDTFEMRLSELKDNEEEFINTLLERFTKAPSSSGSSSLKWNLSCDKHHLDTSMSSVDLALMNKDLSPSEFTHGKVLHCGNLENVSAEDLKRYDYISTGEEFIPLVAQCQDMAFLVRESDADDEDDDSMEVEKSAPIVKSVDEAENYFISLPVNHDSEEMDRPDLEVSSDESKQDTAFLKVMDACFVNDFSGRYCRSKPFLAVYAAVTSLQATAQIGFIAAALDVSVESLVAMLKENLEDMVQVLPPTRVDGADSAEFTSMDPMNTVTLRESMKGGLLGWICSTEYSRLGGEYWIDASIGHNKVCALYLKYCANKSVAVECPWQDYLRTYGPTHLRRSSRGLRTLTTQIRKIDETANIKVTLPRQLGYISGLQEIYARRVGLGGCIPSELGQLSQLRVLSMGNNYLCGELPSSLRNLRNLQRIVLHQNNLQGLVPPEFSELGCIVNLAGNPKLEHGPDVPAEERQALVDIFSATNGNRWNNKTNWNSILPVAKWYKVGILTSHVHSIVMSSNGMDGLVGSIPVELCRVTTLRRLCICRCGLNGKIPAEIGNLSGLEELQLFGNNISGQVPSSLGNLVNLKLLSLGEYTGGNDFTAMPLPSCLSSLVKLEALFMANCNLKGSLPNWIGNLTELRQLDLQRNMLSGTVPRTIGRLENLLYLNIKDNVHLTGVLPMPELLSLSRLNRLSLVHCNFHNADEALEQLSVHLPRCKVWI